MKILAVVVLYHPNIELLTRNIKAFISDVDHIIIWENMREKESTKYRVFLDKKIEYICAGDNIGISKALNNAWHYAKKYGYDYLLTMDQDSIWISFREFMETSILKNRKQMAIIGPNTKGTNIKHYKSCNNFIERNWVITSGMLVPIQLLDQIGGYNENFFVDSIDIELCLRAKDKGFLVYLNTSGFLSQSYGIQKCISVFGRQIYVQYYNPFRINGIFKGDVILYRIYKNKKILKELYVFLRSTLISILVNKGMRLKRAKSMLIGIYQGIKFNKYTYFIFQK